LDGTAAKNTPLWSGHRSAEGQNRRKYQFVFAPKMKTLAGQRHNFTDNVATGVCVRLPPMRIADAMSLAAPVAAALHSRQLERTWHSAFGLGGKLSFMPMYENAPDNESQDRDDHQDNDQRPLDLLDAETERIGGIAVTHSP
jgi:hypothetical protein